MNREGHEDTNFFLGQEVEHTPAYGMKTLFVVDLQLVEEIELMYGVLGAEHIFFGANHSFDPAGSDGWRYDYYKKWEEMIEYFLKKDMLCTLDIPVAIAEDFLESSLVEYNNFIPQIRIPLPYIKQWNYNTMIKLDDKDFKATNPGVWCHRLHDLMSTDTYTDWRDYRGDKNL
jgi:hypothetical protein